MHYDVLLFHPPSVHDFRKMPRFPGPIAELVTSTPVFITVPVGLISIADYLDRHGVKTRVVNLGEMMLTNPAFNVDNYLQEADAAIYGVDLHWCVSSHGSIEIAKLCKKYHPDALVVLGGLTATRFASEIVSHFPFIDAVVRGEAERPMLKLADCSASKKLLPVPNLTYRDNGKLRVTDDLKVVDTLDLFDFTRIDLLEPQTLMITQSSPSGSRRHWSLPICRGCTFNCVTCGGSSYSYRSLFKRNSPAFRSPDQLAEDLQKLQEKRIDVTLLFGDIRMGGRKYWQNLLTTLHREKIGMSLVMDLFYPANEQFLQTLSSSKPAKTVSLLLSPESGSETVRASHGRSYSNADLLTTAKLCSKYGLGLNVYFMIGLASQNRESITTTYELCAQLLRLGKFKTPLLVGGTLMLLLDPGSLAFDFPARYGYRLLFNTFNDYYAALSMPFWTQWISYETKSLQKKDLIELWLQFWDHRITLYETYGLLNRAIGSKERSRIRLEQVLLEEFAQIIDERNEPLKEQRLKALWEAYRDGRIYDVRLKRRLNSWIEKIRHVFR